MTLILRLCCVHCGVHMFFNVTATQKMVSGKTALDEQNIEQQNDDHQDKIHATQIHMQHHQQ